MKKLLQKHGEKLTFVVVLLLCGFMAYSQMDASNAAADTAREVQDSAQKLGQAAKSSNVSDKYVFGSANLVKIEGADKRAERDIAATQTRLIDEVPPYVSYLRPTRPKIDQPGVGTQNVKDYAEFNVPTDVVALPDQGHVYVAFKPSKEIKYMELVRVEIFRGEGSAEKIDKTKPYGVIPFASEEPPPPAPPADPTNPATPAPANPDEGRGARNRSVAEMKKEAAGGAAPSAAGKGEKKVEIPSAYADMQAFEDSNVQPRTDYFYVVRAIGRVSPKIGTAIPSKEKLENGDPAKNLIVTEPKGLQSVAPVVANPDVKLVATDFTQIASAKTPAGFDVQLTGIQGNFPAFDAKEFEKVEAQYKGIFAVRVWVAEAQDWVRMTVYAGRNEKIKGTLTFKDAAKKSVSKDFDTGYLLEDIVWEEIKKEEIKLVPVKDEKGQPKLDPKGLPIKEEQKVVTSSKAQVALLKDEKGRPEKLVKGAVRDSDQIKHLKAIADEAKKRLEEIRKAAGTK